MTKTFIGVRDVDEDTFRKFRMLSIKRELKLGEALTLAMKKELAAKEIGKKAHFRVKPFDFGQGTKKMSKEVDKVLYS